MIDEAGRARDDRGYIMTAQSGLRFLEDRWDDAVAAKLDAPELLRYRSNLLGSDLRITNFGGGNTSSKLDQVDPLDGKAKQILWGKGSGGDLGSIKRAGFATLYMEKLLALEEAYRGVELEDEMVEINRLYRIIAKCSAQLGVMSVSTELK